MSVANLRVIYIIFPYILRAVSSLERINFKGYCGKYEKSVHLCNNKHDCCVNCFPVIAL